MKVTIIKADASNKEWNWMAVCEQHLQVVTADTRKELTNYTLADFCTCCAGKCSCDCFVECCISSKVDA